MTCGTLELGVEAESFESWYSWFLSILPQWFITPTRIFLEIHDSRRLLMTYSINEFPRGYFLSFCVVFFWCSNFCFHPELHRFLDHCFSVSSFVLARYRVFCYWTLSTSVTGETSRISASNARIIWGGGGVQGHATPEKNWNLDLRKRHILQSLDRTQLIHTYFVALFSETRYSWFPSRSTKIHDSPVLKTKIHDSYKFCNYDSWFMIRLPPRKLKPLQRKYLNRGKILILIIFNLKMKCSVWKGNYLSC